MDIEDLNKKLDDFTTQIEQRFDEFRKKIDECFSTTKPADESRQKHRYKNHDTPFWGVVLVVAGVLLMGNHLHWFDLDIPFLPTALIVLGCYLIIEHRHNR